MPWSLLDRALFYRIEIIARILCLVCCREDQILTAPVKGQNAAISRRSAIEDAHAADVLGIRACVPSSRITIASHIWP